MYDGHMTTTTKPALIKRGQTIGTPAGPATVSLIVETPRGFYAETTTGQWMLAEDEDVTVLTVHEAKTVRGLVAEIECAECGAQIDVLTDHRTVGSNYELACPSCNYVNDYEHGDY